MTRLEETNSRSKIFEDNASGMRRYWFCCRIVDGDCLKGLGSGLLEMFAGDAAHEVAACVVCCLYQGLSRDSEVEILFLCCWIAERVDLLAL